MKTKDNKESKTKNGTQVKTNRRHSGKIILWIIVFLIFCGLVWMFFPRSDESYRTEIVDNMSVALGFTFPFDFKIQDLKEEIAIGDYFVSSTLVLSSNAYDSLKAKIDFTKWKQLENAYQLSFQKPDGKSGYDFVLITTLDSIKGFYVQYGNE